MKRRRWLAWAACALLLAGCSLAKPEAEGKIEDRFVGFYVVGGEGGKSDFYSNPNLVEYGSETLAVEGLESFDIPQNILIADKENGYAFPGLEGGYSLFSVTTRDGEGGVYFSSVSNMAPDETYKMTSVNGDTTSTEMSGIIYYGPPAGAVNWDSYQNSMLWTAYRVYQAADGTVYLDGSGNSYQGGGDMGFTSEETFTTTENGEKVAEAVTKVSVQFKETPRLERLTVTQFDGDNQILSAQDLALREDLPGVRWEPGAEWALVEEASAGGVKRTAYSVPGEGEEPVSHQVVLLDDAGMGRLAYLNIQ